MQLAMSFLGFPLQHRLVWTHREPETQNCAPGMNWTHRDLRAVLYFCSDEQEMRCLQRMGENPRNIFFLRFSILSHPSHQAISQQKQWPDSHLKLMGRRIIFL